MDDENFAGHWDTVLGKKDRGLEGRTEGDNLSLRRIWRVVVGSCELGRSSKLTLLQKKKIGPGWEETRVPEKACVARKLLPGASSVLWAGKTGHLQRK